METRRIFGRESRDAAWHNIEQTAILVLSAVAVALVNLGPTDKWRFWGNIAGICASPFWMHANFRARPLQWGQLVLSLAYAVIWIVGAVKYH